MSQTVQSFSAQSNALTRIEAQMEALEERVGELRKSLYGQDGNEGIVKKIAHCEGALGGIQKDIQELKTMADSFKQTIFKIVLLVIGSGALSGGAAAKLLGAIAP